MNIYILVTLIAFIVIEGVSIVFMLRFLAKYKDICYSIKHLDSTVAMQQSDIAFMKSYLDKNEELMKTNNTMIKEISEQYDIMDNTYHAICNIQTRLLECWKNVEERYSDCYEEYKNTTAKLREVVDRLNFLASELEFDELEITMNDDNKEEK